MRPHTVRRPRLALGDGAATRVGFISSSSVCPPFRFFFSSNVLPVLLPVPPRYLLFKHDRVNLSFDHEPLFYFLFKYVSSVSLCSVCGSTHTESGKLYRKVKHRSPPKSFLTPTAKARPVRRRSRRSQGRGAPQTEHGLGVLLTVKFVFLSGNVLPVLRLVPPRHGLVRLGHRATSQHAQALPALLLAERREAPRVSHYSC